MPSLHKVSVIIPCYNRDRFITETVESVLNQTYPNIELIVVNDGSTDKSRSVLKRFSDKLRILEHPGGLNKGQSASINLGLSQSTGKYIAILDSDDLFLPRKIQKQVDFLEANSEVDLVYGNGEVIDENGNILYKFYEKQPCEESNPSNVLLNCYFLLPNNSLFKSDLIKRVGFFDESLRSGQDHDMAIRIAEVGKLAYLDEILFQYRKHNNSISGKNADLRWKNGFIILEKAINRYNYPSSIIRKRRALLNFRMGQISIEKGKYLISTIYFLKAGILDPIRAFKVITSKNSTGGLH